MAVSGSPSEAKLWNSTSARLVASDWASIAPGRLLRADSLFYSLVFFYFAVADVDDAVGVERYVVLMGDQHDGVALAVQALERRHDLVAGGAVEVAGGLVGQQDGGVVHQGASDGHALALAAGELVGLVIHAVLEIDVGQGLLGSLDARLGRSAAVNQRQLDVVERCGARQQVEGLENKPNFLVADAG